MRKGTFFCVFRQHTNKMSEMRHYLVPGARYGYPREGQVPLDVPRVTFGPPDCRPEVLAIRDWRPASGGKAAVFQADVLMRCGDRYRLAGRVCVNCDLPGASSAPLKTAQQMALERLDRNAGGAITFADVDRLCPVPLRTRSLACLRIQLHKTGEILSRDSAIKTGPYRVAYSDLDPWGRVNQLLRFKDDTGLRFAFGMSPDFASGKVYTLEPEMEDAWHPRVMIPNCNASVVEKLEVRRWYTREIEKKPNRRSARSEPIPGVVRMDIVFQTWCNEDHHVVGRVFFDEAGTSTIRAR